MSCASATHHRDPRTGQSIWSARRRPAIDGGFDVLIVDRRGPTDGSSAASTAMLQYEIDTPLHQMAERIGRDKAERIWCRWGQSADALRERTERLGLDLVGATRS